MDKNGNILVSPCKECEEEISNVVKERIDEYKKWYAISPDGGKEIEEECQEGENLLTDVIDALEADGLASAEILNALEEVKHCFWSIERLV